MAGVESEEGVSGNGKAELGEDLMQMVEDLGGMGRRGLGAQMTSEISAEG